MVEARSRLRGDIACGDFFSALIADETCVGDLAARLVPQHNRRAIRMGDVLIAPLHQDHDRGEKVSAGVGEPVLVPVGIDGVRNAAEQTMFDQRLQPRRQGGPRNIEIADQLTVASHPEEGLTQNKQGPSIAYDVKRARDGFGLEAMRQIT